MKILFKLIAILLVLPAGCTQLKGYLDIVQDRGLSPNYLRVLEKSTRSETVYSQFETMVHIKATFKSPEFYRAYGEEYARIYQQNPRDKGLTLMGMEDEAREFIQFYFYAYLPDREANDFAKPRSIWAVFLLDEKGRRIDHVDLRRIERITPLVESFFPYVNRHHGNFYLVRFPAGNVGPLSDKGQGLRLVFASVLGRVTLTWN